MPVYVIVLITVAAVIILYCAIMIAFAAYAQHAAFGRRFEKNKYLKYFTAQDFNLNAEPVHTFVGKDKLNGFIYTVKDLKDCSALVIFSHGMGPGQCSYMTEIAYLCNHDCAVLAFDWSGCTLSEGKSLKALEHSTRCLVSAARFAKADDRLNGMKMVYFGHSMGGYSALCACKFEKVDGTVAFSAPEDPSSVISCRAWEVIGRPAARLMRPFLKITGLFVCGKYANVRASRAVSRSGVKTLLLQGDIDPKVTLKISAYSVLKDITDGNTQCILCKGKGHNPYNTQNAEMLLAELGSGVARADKMSEEERESFFSTRDYDAICEEDPEVMATVMAFINNL